MLPAKPSKILVAMSGGVDSSVAASMLKQAGHEVVGCFMRLGSEDSVEDGYTCDPTKVREGKQGCCSVNDADDARGLGATGPSCCSSGLRCFTGALVCVTRSVHSQLQFQPA